MAALTKGLYEAYLKEWYPGTVAQILTYTDHPLVGILEKNTNVRGTSYPKPVRFTNTAGRSADYPTAHQYQTPSNRVRWVNTHADNYSKATVYNKIIELSLGSDAAFREALTDEVDAAYGAFADDLHFELFGDGSGARATATGAPTGAVVPVSDAQFFETGMVLQKSANGSTLDNGGEVQVVVNVDRAGNKITLDADWSVASANGHLIVQAGDFGKKANGLKAWIPTYAGIVAGGGSVANTFLTVDRSADGRLCGWAGVAGSTAGLEVTESLVNSAAVGQKEGARPTVAMLNPLDRARLALETEQRARYAKVYSTEGNISYSALMIETGAGSIPVISDRGQQIKTSYMIDTRNFELFSAGELPSMFDKDGNFYHREEALDTIAFYLYGFYNLQTQAPGRHIYIPDLGY
jgi:hypothetical protein